MSAGLAVVLGAGPVGKSLTKRLVDRGVQPPFDQGVAEAAASYQST